MEEPRATRCTTLEFLADCHPSIREIHAYWEGKRRGRLMPSRADIDPSEMIQFLPNIVLVDVLSHAPLTLVYRLVGTREVAVRGRDPTNRRVDDSFYCRSRDAALANYREVIESRAPVFEADDHRSPFSRLNEHGSVFLPLSDDDRTVNKILVYTAFSPY